MLKKAEQTQRNVFGEPIATCSLAPLTGFFRGRMLQYGAEDIGSHTVCPVMTEEFLAFSRSAGNDLSTPQPEIGFPGLNPSDR